MSTAGAFLMIARMNRRQRQAIRELIQCSLKHERDQDTISSLQLMEAEKEFEKCFMNEDPSEDDFNHVKPT